MVGDIEYPGYPASGATLDGVKITDPAVRIAFFALRYDQDVNTPMRVFARDEAGNTARADFDHRDVPQAVQEEPHRARRQVPRSRRAGDPRRHDRDQARGRQAREVPGDQRRAAPEERREDRVVREADRAGDALGRRRVPSVHQHRRRVRVRRPAHLRLPGQGGRPADAPRLRPRVVRRQRRSSPRTAARCCSPTSSASTATA